MDISGYRYSDAGLNDSHGYLLPTVFRLLDEVSGGAAVHGLFELGCGNGSVSHALAQRGWQVTGVDPSAEGIAAAKAAYPQLKLFAGSAYDDLAAPYGRFPVVLSLEVVEHVYSPRKYAATLFDLVERGGASDRVDALSRLLEERGARLVREDGPAFHRLVGSRSY